VEAVLVDRAAGRAQPSQPGALQTAVGAGVRLAGRAAGRGHVDGGGWHSHAEGAPCGGAAAELVQHALARHRLTAPLPAADLATLAAAFTPVAVADAGCVFEEGEARDLALYVVERGAIERYEGGAPGGARGH
jgi:hypothetical protein